jgi:hypothetical protein
VNQWRQQQLLAQVCLWLHKCRSRQRPITTNPNAQANRQRTRIQKPAPALIPAVRMVAPVLILMKAKKLPRIKSSLWGGHKIDSNVNYCLIYNRNLREKKIRNICPFDISVTEGCVGKTTRNYTQAKADYSYS